MAYSDKTVQAASAHKHYLRNTALIKSRAVKFSRIARERNRDFLDNYLLSHPCIDCGESDIIVLEFDHVRGKKVLEICIAVNRCWSIARLEGEISKCEVRCANCHRRVTVKRRKFSADAARRERAQVS